MNCEKCIHFKLCNQDGITAEFEGMCTEDCMLFEDSSYFVAFEHKLNEVVFIPCHTKYKRFVVKGKTYKLFADDRGTYYVVSTKYDDFIFRNDDFGTAIFTSEDQAKKRNN